MNSTTRTALLPKPMSRMRLGWLGIAPGLLCACAVGPDFVRPTPQVPQHFSQRSLTPPALGAEGSSGTGGGAGGGIGIVIERTESLSDWWSRFGDAELDSLIKRALASNLDVRAAVLRIEEARTQRAIAAAGFAPTLVLDASYTRQRFSQTTPTGSLFSSVGSIRLPGLAQLGIPNPYNQFQLSGTASWEPDLFGRVRRAVEVADANVQVSIEDQHAISLSMLADVAQSYLQLRGAQDRLRVAKENLDTVNELLELTRDRLAAGLTTQIDVSNATAQAEVTRAEIPASELQITEDVNLLSRLLAREPEALRAELEGAAPVPAVPAEVGIGLPAELARRRPDIREAEASLHAATAQIGVAEADLFPHLTLSATGGDQSETLGQLFDWASRFGSIGPALELPVFALGRWRTVRLYDVRAQEAALAYQRTVLGALHEVENAIAAYSADQLRRRALEAAVTQNRDALALSRLRYQNGVASFLDVLDIERSLQQNELALVEARAAVSTDLVQIYRALGGEY
jgi:outer membrane protein, multidrug efflux system